MMRKTHVYFTTALLPSALLVQTLCVHSTHASLLEFEGQYQSELEERSAVSNQRVYDELKAQGCNDADRTPTDSCTGGRFSVWQNVRELVHTANDLAGNNEPTEYSLGIGLDGLGFALRWTAGEEFSSQESLAGSFVSGQLSGLASRVSALRSGARGFSLSGGPTDNSSIASTYQQNSGLNAGDEVIGGWSRWGGFLNGNHTYGDKGPSEREDAFDFEGSEINGGVDYRIDNHWVVGAVFGYQQEEIDFDSSQSIVDGTVDMDALSIMPFVLYQSEAWFYSASLGYQQAEFETDRSIRYPSLNPDSESTDTTARSENKAQIFTANVSGGYNIEVFSAFSIEPSIALNYQDINIEEYTEKDLQNDGFNFTVDEQAFTSREIVLGLKAQYVWSTRIGVFIPYADAQFYTQYDHEARTIDAAYAETGAQLTPASRFSLPTDGIDQDYKIYTLGLSTVIRGASQSSFGSDASGGIQAFLSVREIKDVGNYNQRIISGGMRYEF